jgi:hypothetical protein
MVWKDLENELVASYPEHDFSSEILFNEEYASL